MKNKNNIMMLILFIFLIVALVSSELIVKINKTKPYLISSNLINKKEITKENITTIKISAVGDCTLGWDTRYGYNTRFDKYLHDNNNDYGYYFANVKDLFANDDITIANLEGTFTNYQKKEEKEFNFSAPDEYKNILVKGNIDIVVLANNHSYDYGKQGFEDTKDALNSVNIPYYGKDIYLIQEYKGIKIGFFGLLDIYGQKYKEVDKALRYLKEQNCDLIIASMHWGIEGDLKQSTEQVKMGHYLIDNGADLVLGSHPHRIQGIEKYNDKYIVYSLANFSFGGNQNPPDKDTFIYQQIFTFKDNILQNDDNINIIPASVSSVKNTNNYQPIILESNEKIRVLNKILNNSTGFEYP